MQQRVYEPMETLHVYLVREGEEGARRPFALLPLGMAALCLLAMLGLTLASGAYPAYEQKTIKVPVRLLPLKTVSATVPVIPTGVKTTPATHAHGILTLTNGSVVSAALPHGMLFVSQNGVEVMTETAVVVPAGSATGYGVATVAAQVVPIGYNLATLALDQVVGTALYVRNLAPFTGGRALVSVVVATAQDRLRAIVQARAALLPATLAGVLLHPRRERISGQVTVRWQCQFVIYRVPSWLHVMSVQLDGMQALVTGEAVVRPQPFRGK